MSLIIDRDTLAGPALPLGKPGDAGPTAYDVAQGGPVLFHGRSVGEIIEAFKAVNPDADPAWVRWMRVQFERAADYRGHLGELAKAGRLVMRPILDTAAKAGTPRVIGVSLRDALPPRPVLVRRPSTSDPTEYYELGPGWLLASSVELARIAASAAARDLGSAPPAIRFFASTASTAPWVEDSQPVARVWQETEGRAGFSYPRQPGVIWVHAGETHDPHRLQEVTAHETYHDIHQQREGPLRTVVQAEAHEREAIAYGGRVLRRLYG